MGPLGIVSTNRIVFGHLYAAKRRRQKSMISSTAGVAPSTGTTNALTSSPYLASPTPTTAVLPDFRVLQQDLVDLARIDVSGRRE